MDIEFRWFKPARSLSYILQYRKKYGDSRPWEDWEWVPHIREDREEEDGRSGT